MIRHRFASDWYTPDATLGTVFRICLLCLLTAAALMALVMLYSCVAGIRVAARDGQVLEIGRLVAGVSGSVFAPLVGFAVGLMEFGTFIKGRQILGYPSALGTHVESKVVLVRQEFGPPMASATVTAEWRFCDQKYSGPVMVSPYSFNTQEVLIAYLGERIARERCMLAVNPEKPARPFLMDIDSRTLKPETLPVFLCLGLGLFFAYFSDKAGAFAIVLTAIRDHW